MNTGTRSPSRLTAGGTALATFLAVALAFALAACGGNSPGRTGAPSRATADARSAAGSAARSVAAVASGSGAKAVTVKIPRYVAARNVRRYVSTTGCTQAGGQGWRLSGTATNTWSSARAYSIVVDFVTVKGNTVLDTKLLNVGPIAPKSAVDWSVTGAAGQQHVACVIRQALTK